LWNALHRRTEYEATQDNLEREGYGSIQVGRVCNCIHTRLPVVGVCTHCMRMAFLTGRGVCVCQMESLGAQSENGLDDLTCVLPTHRTAPHSPHSLPTALHRYSCTMCPRLLGDSLGDIGLLLNTLPAHLVHVPCKIRRLPLDCHYNTVIQE
jgi:hypothetical protein